MLENVTHCKGTSNVQYMRQDTSLLDEAMLCRSIHYLQRRLKTWQRFILRGANYDETRVAALTRPVRCYLAV